MLNFVILGFPVRVHWLFWVTCLLLGGGLYASTPEAWARVAVWAAVVFVSILVHELGHALAGRRFGAMPSIQLHGLGGVTFLPGRNFSRKESIFVSAAGPAAGFLLGIAVLAFAAGTAGLPPLLATAVRYALFVNFAWTLINLLPIQPMDGGQILRDFLGPERVRITNWAGVICAGIVAVLAFQAGLYFLAVLMAIFAYHNFNPQPIQGGVVPSSRGGWR